MAEADAAIEQLATFLPDLIVLEWCLSAGSGEGLSKRLRDLAVRHGKPVKILVYSGFPRDRTGESFDAILWKPAEGGEIQRMLDALLPPRNN